VDQEAFVYIMAGNKPEVGRVPLYVGSTTDLPRRAWEHRIGQGSVHTRRYRIRRLVWYERQESIEAAKVKEYRMKRWPRADKDKVITEFNPEWRDLFEDLA
jgi:putative endonuclease